MRSQRQETEEGWRRKEGRGEKGVIGSLNMAYKRKGRQVSVNTGGPRGTFYYPMVY